MADYSMAQIKAMQEDATRRVREMNRRSKSTLQSTANQPQIKEEPHNQQNPPIAKPPQETHNNHNAHGNPLNFLGSLDLKKLISGDDQSLLLLLVLILLNDDMSDDFLIYALIYIML